MNIMLSALTLTPRPIFPYAIMSPLCFLALALDKRKAQKGRWRIPESTLHTLELLGGWPGSLLAQRIFRHKTRKRSYRFTFRVIVLLHLGVWAGVFLFPFP